MTTLATVGVFELQQVVESRQL